LSTDDLGREQEYVALLYGRLDGLRERTSTRLTEVLRRTGGTHQARTERDVATARHSEQLARFEAAENGLCFGRLDLRDGERRYIGRIGIVDEFADYEPLLIDWRAPAARPFYLATAAAPDGVRRRRHIRTRHRTVVGLDDEVLDLAAADPARPDGLAGEAALLAALGAHRTGRMADIVETIQAEQDRVIRAPHCGVLVVQGGPGTGKTAVALHRAAFLLYTYRQQLSRRGVLIVGPNATFLRYIGHVLPSLGETGAVLSTVAELYPGVSARRAEPPEAAAIKGRPAMAGIVAAAVRDRQRAPDEGVPIGFDGETLRLDRRTCLRARERARRSRRPHNEARPIFVDALLDALARQVADRLGASIGGRSLLDPADVAEIRRELHDDAQVRDVIAELWPILTPQRLLADLFSSADRLGAAAPELSDADRRLLLREPGGGWTPADVPLLDEAAELLGEDDRAAEARARRLRRARIAEAQGVLDILAGSAAHELDDLDDWGDHDRLTAGDLLDADRLADRHQDIDDRTVAQRAAADRTWTFGHVIVDEAQELSEMAWRMLMRRCPSRSMTLVGDIAQTSDLAGASSWQQVLEPHVGSGWRLRQLTVNYRTPAEIMAVAADVLAGLEPPLDPPRSVRETGVQPWRQEASPADLTARLAGLVARETAAVGDGRLAVLVPAARLDELGRAIRAAMPWAPAAGDEPDLDDPDLDNPDLDDPVVVLSVKQAKGLEFDSVLVVDPERILADSPRGRHDLYVALTRATQRLGVLHTGAPPALLARLLPSPHPCG
jgi:DNA helicase IV